MNEQLIDTVISQLADEQVINLTKLLSSLDIQMVGNIKSANALNTAVSNSKTFTDLNKNATAATINIEKVTQAQLKTVKAIREVEIANNKVTTSNNALAASQDRANKKAQDALSPYKQLSKELETLRNKAKDVGVQFGEHSKQFKEASKPVQELDEKLKGIDKTLGQSQRNVGNYGNAFKGVLSQYIPFGESTIKVSENLKTLGLDLEESAGELSGLAAGFAGFAIGGFIIAISSAVSYLSQFKSTTNEVEADMAGLKNVFNSFGGKIVESSAFSKIGKFFSEGFKHTLIGAETTGSEDFKKGYEAEKQTQGLERNDELTKAANDELKVESEKNRALSGDRKIDIKDRIAYLKDAQKIEGEILENQKKNSERTFDVAIQVGKKLGTLREDQVKELREGFEKGDLKPGQDLASFGRTLTPEAFELYKKAIEKRVAYLQGANNQIVQLQADADNLQLKADRALAQAQERLDRATLAGEIDKSKLIIDNDKATYDEKIKANERFINSSLRLAKVERDAELGNAGLGGKGGADSRTEAVTRLAIEQEYQNNINKIRLEGLGNQQKIQKAVSEQLKTELADLMNGEKAQSDAAVDELRAGSERYINLLQQQHDKEIDLVDKKYTKGKITQKKYNDQLLAIDDQYNLERLAQTAFTDQAILELKQATLDKQISNLQGNATPEDIQKLTKELGIPEAQKNADSSNLAVGAAFKKQEGDRTKAQKDAEQERKEIAEKAIEYTVKAIDEVDKLRQQAYENEIKRIEKLGQRSDEQADNEKTRITNSIASNATKAREIALIDAQTASRHKALIVEENKEKHKADVAEKEATIAKIILNGALAVVKSLGNPIVEAITIASVALELATAIATPLPVYAKGTKNYPGGLGIWGEAGMERATLPDGTIRYSNGAEVANFPKGTVITPHMELMQQIKPDAVKLTGGEQIPWRELIKAVKDNKTNNRSRLNVNVDMGFETYKRSYLRR